MKLQFLYIEDYKALKQFSIEFGKEVSILIGINGSGKSTLLECIAQIFSDAFLGREAKFGFRLIYDIRLEEVVEQSVTLGAFKTDYLTVEIESAGKGQPLVFAVHIADEILRETKDIEKRFGSLEKILPGSIVIYYSGFAAVMKQLVAPHDDRLTKDYKAGKNSSSRPFLYFEPALFNLILLSLLSFEYGDIPQFLSERAKIKKLQNVHIRLQRPPWGKGKIQDWWGAKGEVKALLDTMDRIGHPLLIDDTTKNREGRRGNVVMEGWQNEYLNITILGQEKLFEIREHFAAEKTLFEVLNALVIDGFQPEITFSFEQEGEEYEQSFHDLSEGEQQAIVTRGLVELSGNENVLFLFDEPDTYLHPSWQRKFIDEIGQLATLSEVRTNQFLITTHSPQLLSNANPKYSEVQIMEGGKVVATTPKHYGRDANNILYEMMGVRQRNKEVQQLLKSLFNIIEEEDLAESLKQYGELEKILGEDDPEMVVAKLQLDYLKEASDEENN